MGNNMNLFKAIQKRIYKLIKYYRWKYVSKLLDDKSETLLDIGCQDLFFYNRLKKHYNVTLADCKPKNRLVKKENIGSLSFKDNSFDITLCLEVLEHTHNPVKAITELKRVTKKQLIISIPYEPFFTVARFLIWEKEHLWAITPKALRIYLGRPTYEKTIFLKRYYVAVWNFNELRKPR